MTLADHQPSDFLLGMGQHRLHFASTTVPRGGEPEIYSEPSTAMYIFDLSYCDRSPRRGRGLNGHLALPYSKCDDQEFRGSSTLAQTLVSVSI